MKGSSLSWITGGLGMLAVAAGTTIAAALGINDAGVPAMGLIAAIGAGMIGVGALQLPRWARVRRQQMEDIAARLSLAAKSPKQP